MGMLTVRQSMNKQQLSSCRGKLVVGTLLQLLNAARAFYLAPIAAEYLDHLSTTKTLNKLKQDVLKKLNNDSELAQLKLDQAYSFTTFMLI